MGGLQGSHCGDNSAMIFPFPSTSSPSTWWPLVKVIFFLSGRITPQHWMHTIPCSTHHILFILLKYCIWRYLKINPWLLQHDYEILTPPHLTKDLIFTYTSFKQLKVFIKTVSVEMVLALMTNPLYTGINLNRLLKEVPLKGKKFIAYNVQSDANWKGVCIEGLHKC